MRHVVYIGFVFLVSCSDEQVQEENVDVQAEIVEDSIGQTIPGEMYEVKLCGNHFVLDSEAGLLEITYEDAVDGNPYKVDSFIDYDILPPDTLDINLDGFMDLKMEYAEPGYSFEAWYVWDPDNHYYSSHPFQLQYPTMLDSSRLILFTTELQGMDGDYSSQLLKIIAGTPILYGRVESEIIHHEDGDWHVETQVFNSSDKEVTEQFYQTESQYQDFELKEFWKDNYLNFME